MHDAARVGVASAKSNADGRTYWAMVIAGGYEKPKPAGAKTAHAAAKPKAAKSDAAKSDAKFDATKSDAKSDAAEPRSGETRPPTKKRRGNRRF